MLQISHRVEWVEFKISIPSLNSPKWRTSSPGKFAFLEKIFDRTEIVFSRVKPVPLSNITSSL